MVHFTLLTLEEQKLASAIAQHILAHAYHDDVANICCYGNFVSDDVVVDTRMRVLLGMKAERAIRACGGDLFQMVIQEMACQLDKQSEFIDRIALACFQHKLAWAGKPVVFHVQ